jgi:cell division initiation protein
VKITPLDIRRKEFKRSVRGYSDEEVDVFLDEVADEFERLFQENMELQDRAHRLEEQIAAHAQVRDALERTLVSAQLQAEEIRSNAHKETELILREAHHKAREIVDESYGDTQKLQQSLVQLKHLDEEFRFKFRSLLEGYLNLLSQEPIATTVGAEAATLQSVPTALASGGTVAGGPNAPAAPNLVAVPTQVPTPVVVNEQPPALVKRVDEVPAGASGTSVIEVVAPGAATTSVAEASAVAEARRAIIDQVGVTGAEAAGAGSEEITAESPLSPARPAEARPVVDDSLRGFFFGRQMEDIDDTFPGEDPGKQDKARDFEW